MSDYEDSEDDVQNPSESRDTSENIFLYGGIFFMIALIIILSFVFTSCTITQTQVHTEGQGSGDVQESETTSPNVQPTTSLTVPIKAL